MDDLATELHEEIATLVKYVNPMGPAGHHQVVNTVGKTKLHFVIVDIISDIMNYFEYGFIFL